MNCFKVISDLKTRLDFHISKKEVHDKLLDQRHLYQKVALHKSLKLSVQKTILERKQVCLKELKSS